MKGLLKITCGVIALPFLCGILFVVAYVVIVGITIPQLPKWAQPSVTQWLLDIPQDSDNHNIPNWHDGNNSDPTRAFSGTWTDYFGPDGAIIGIPIQGPFTKWGQEYEKPLLGCVYHDAHYSDHTGIDFPVDVGNSSGPHLHYGVKKREGENYWWVNPDQFFGTDDVLAWGCSG
jgi:hypothetical protein